ncbi:MAG: outer membrane beta-barrel protein [Opitutales bacterium]|nr:outer membrane beta-barrel protein [Opitutales bacterium]
MSPASRESTPLQVGPVLFRPSINYKYTDANNLLRSVGNEQDSEIQNISLNLIFDYQEFWSFSYRPTWTYYSNAAFDDTDSHSANFSSDFAVADWRIGFNQTYSDSNGSLVQTGSQTQQEIFGTTLSASRQLNSTWYLDLSADQDLRSTSRFSDVSEWSTSGWLRHQASSVVNSSIGLTWGYADVDPGLNTEYMQFLLRFGFNPSEKLRASLQGGIDSREVDAPGFDKEESPTYNASLQYQPFDYTTIGINLSRGISTSYFSNFNNETEALTLSLNQRLLGRFNLTVSYGERSSDYLGLLGNFVVGRADDYDSFSVDLSTQLANRINVSAFYRKNENSTNANGFGFSSDQSGFSIGYRY